MDIVHHSTIRLYDIPDNFIKKRREYKKNRTKTLPQEIKTYVTQEKTLNVKQIESLGDSNDHD